MLARGLGELLAVDAQEVLDLERGELAERVGELVTRDESRFRIDAQAIAPPEPFRLRFDDRIGACSRHRPVDMSGAFLFFSFLSLKYLYCIPRQSKVNDALLEHHQLVGKNS